MMKRIGLLLGALITFSAPATATAGLITYTDLNAFQAATTGLNTINFSGIAPPNEFVSYPSPGGLTVDGVNFSITNPSSGEALNVTSSNFYSSATYASDFLVNAFSSTTPAVTETITLPTPVTAIGLDLGTFKGGVLGFTFSNGETFSQSNTATFGQTSFIGFTSSAPITSVSISGSSSGGEALVVADFKYGILATPEPVSFALAASGLLAIGCRRLLNGRAGAGRGMGISVVDKLAPAGAP